MLHCDTIMFSSNDTNGFYIWKIIHNYDYILNIWLNLFNIDILINF